MLSEERIRLMTKLVIYEKRKGKETIPMCQYYKNDYVSFQMAKTWVTTTVAYVLLTALWALCSLEDILNGLNLMFGSLLWNLLIGYILMFIFYQVVSYIYYVKQYDDGRKSFKKYLGYLKRLGRIYEKE